MKVKEGRTVRLTISNAERSVIVPDLIGRSERSAELDIKQVGLEIDTVYKEYNSDVPPGNVTWPCNISRRDIRVIFLVDSINFKTYLLNI